MARLKTRWNKTERARSYSETGSALAMSMWKLASESLLNLENEGFETRTNAQRLDAISEFLAYSLHLVDRLAHPRLDNEQREQLIGAVGARLNEIINDNRRDVGGGVDDDGNDAEQPFVNLLNLRSDEYSDCHFDTTDGPGFDMRRILGNHIQRVMGDKDSKWIPDYVLDAEAPQIYKGLKRASGTLLN